MPIQDVSDKWSSEGRIRSGGPHGGAIADKDGSGHDLEPRSPHSKHWRDLAESRLSDMLFGHCLGSVGELVGQVRSSPGSSRANMAGCVANYGPVTFWQAASLCKKRPLQGRRYKLRQMSGVCTCLVKMCCGEHLHVSNAEIGRSQAVDGRRQGCRGEMHSPWCSPDLSSRSALIGRRTAAKATLGAR